MAFVINCKRINEISKSFSVNNALFSLKIFCRRMWHGPILNVSDSDGIFQVNIVRLHIFFDHVLSRRHGIFILNTASHSNSIEKKLDFLWLKIVSSAENIKRKNQNASVVKTKEKSDEVDFRIFRIENNRKRVLFI